MTSARLVRALAPCSVLLSVVAAQDPYWFDAPMIDADPQRIYSSVADLDGDGDLDVLAYETPQTPSVGLQPLWNDGEGRVLPGSKIGLAAPLDLWRVLDVGGDGIPDLAMRSNGGSLGFGVLVYPGLPDGGFATPTSRSQ